MAVRSSLWVDIGRWLGAGVGLTVLAAELGRMASSGPALRLALVGCLLVFTLGIWALRPTALVYLLVVWTFALGTLRRIVSYKLVGAPTGTDVLLVIEPVMLVLLAAAALRAGALRRRTRLSRAVLVFSLLVCIGAVNPLQGSLRAGVAALTFFVPLAAFWAGRQIEDSTLRRVLTVVGVLALVAVLYGFAQLVYGFPSWDAAWIADQGYNALHVGNVIRQFASFSSASEYAAFLAVGVAIWSWLVPYRVALPMRLVVVALLVVGLFYQSSRGIIFATVATTGLLLAARFGAGFRAATVFAVATLFLLPIVVSHVAPTLDTQANGSGALVAHQVSGLADPTGPQSTLPGHFRLVVDGIRSAFTNPLGRGISVVTIASSKFGGVSSGTEADPSNVGVALGLPGLVLYLIIVWEGFTRGYRLAVTRRDALSFAVVGVLGVTFLQWLNGGQYAIAYLPWLALGWIDRATQGVATRLPEP